MVSYYNDQMDTGISTTPQSVIVILVRLLRRLRLNIIVIMARIQTVTRPVVGDKVYIDRKEVRNQRFHEQGGKCYYCNVQMIFKGPDIQRKKHNQPDTLCTLEHLTDRLDPRRWNKNEPDSPRRYAAACRKCNTERSAHVCKHTPDELLQKLSHLPRGHRARDYVICYYMIHEYIPPPPFTPKK